MHVDDALGVAVVCVELHIYLTIHKITKILSTKKNKNKEKRFWPVMTELPACPLIDAPSLAAVAATVTVTVAAATLTLTKTAAVVAAVAVVASMLACLLA